MSAVSKTIGPLHFEDLEPRRFEDLIRQLAYDFRSWRTLEATGRAGSDDGFDARGYEIVNPSADVLPDEADIDADDIPPEGSHDRLWLIQCKRERTIAPTKLRKHLNGINTEHSEPLYGIIFAAACDFSKQSRDVFREWCRDHDISEAHIWGKAEVEDQLFQPKNDHLLFAYFGISLQIRHRSIRTALRARLAMKHKCERVLAKLPNYVLLRDPTDDRYPYEPEDADEHARNPIRWRVRKFGELEPRGIVTEVERFFAYVADDGLSWDCIEAVNEVEPRGWENPWSGRQDDIAHAHLRNNARQFWLEIPAKNRALLIGRCVIPYEQIMAIDETGDSIAQFPHIYIDGSKISRTSELHVTGQVEGMNPLPQPENRISFFPNEFPEAPPLYAEP